MPGAFLVTLKCATGEGATKPEGAVRLLGRQPEQTGSAGRSGDGAVHRWDVEGNGASPREGGIEHPSHDFVADDDRKGQILAVAMSRLGQGERGGDSKGVRAAARAEVGELEAQGKGSIGQGGPRGQGALSGRDDGRLGLSSAVARTEGGDGLTPGLGRPNKQALAQEVDQRPAGFLQHLVGDGIRLQVGDPLGQLPGDPPAMGDGVGTPVHAAAPVPFRCAMRPTDPPGVTR